MNSDNNFVTWPPPFILKKHPRAKHVKLKTSVEHGLELVTPLRFNLKHIPSILEENRVWIEKQLQQLAIKPVHKIERLPDEISFHCVNQSFKVAYLPGNQKTRIVSRPQEIVVWGNIEDKQECKFLLIKWVKQFAQLHLLELLQNLSQEINLPYSSATIRDQSTRWGSCSSNKSISLNYKLIFLPAALTRHILIHELCHTKCLNHSDKFWRLVASYDTEWQLHREQMKNVEQFIPAWA